MERSEILKKFPSVFPIDKLPEGAKEECVPVYRVCETGKIEAASFLPTYLSAVANTKEHEDDDDIGYYSLSVFEKVSEIKRLHAFFKKRKPAAIIGYGSTDCSCGIIQRSRERTGKKNSHIDWWLYEGAEPHKYFREIDISKPTEV